MRSADNALSQISDMFCLGDVKLAMTGFFSHSQKLLTSETVDQQFWNTFTFNFPFILHYMLSEVIVALSVLPMQPEKCKLADHVHGEMHVYKSMAISSGLAVHNFLPMTALGWKENLLCQSLLCLTVLLVVGIVNYLLLCCIFFVTMKCE